MERANLEDRYDDLILRSSFFKFIKNIEDFKLPSRFISIIQATSGAMFNKFRPQFEMNGYDFDDVRSIAGVYAFYYFSIYSLELNPNKLEQINSTRQLNLAKPLTAEEIYVHDRNALITFIRQKLAYIANKMVKKSENFYVGKDFSGFFAKTDKSIEASKECIATNPELFGYRRLTKIELKSIVKGKNGEIWKDKNGFEVFKIDHFYNSASDESSDLLLSQESWSTSSPEQILINLEEGEGDDNIKFKTKLDLDYLKKISKDGTYNNMSVLASSILNKSRRGRSKNV